MYDFHFPFPYPFRVGHIHGWDLSLSVTYVWSGDPITCWGECSSEGLNTLWPFFFLYALAHPIVECRYTPVGDNLYVLTCLAVSTVGLCVASLTFCLKLHLNCIVACIYFSYITWINLCILLQLFHWLLLSHLIIVSVWLMGWLLELMMTRKMML